MQRFNRDIDETLAWIGEKDATLSSYDYGRDLNNVQALQRKHEGTERDLAALDAKVCLPNLLLDINTTGIIRGSILI